jgi:lysophospholipase L1-like esterase
MILNIRCSCLFKRHMSKLIRIAVLIILCLIPIGNYAQDLILREPVNFLALGDSYTIGESVPAEERWPRQLFDSIAARGFTTEKLTIIARTGWTTEDLQDAVTGQNPPKEYNLVSLLIGVNDQYQGFDEEWYEPRFEKLLLMAVELAQGNKDAVFVLSIPDYAYTPFGQGSGTITREIDAFNQVNKSITQSYGITYFDITPISREGLAKPGLVAPDGLHPSGLMYSKWVSLILESLIREDITPISGIRSHGLSIGVSPNPASGPIDFTLSGDRNRDVNILIYNAAGQFMTRLGSTGQSTIRLDTSAFAPGIYYYQVMTDAGAPLRGKFIIM